jgi:osmotically-inducible protein OsmY
MHSQLLPYRVLAISVRVFKSDKEKEMNRKILIAALACVSLVAGAQSSSTSKQLSKGSKAVAPRDMASGQASGKAAQKSGGTKDREASQPSVSEGVATAPGNGKPRVATGDVNGDGRADVTATTGQSKGGNNGVSNSKRDVASGQSSGKRQHNPVTIHKEVNASTPKL